LNPDDTPILNQLQEMVGKINDCLEGKTPCCLDVDEALYRTAINRTYYSILLKLREYSEIRDKGKKHGCMSIHRRVYIYLKKRGYGYVAELFNALRKLRVKADYDLEKKVDIETVKQAHAIVKYIEEELKELYEKDKQSIDRSQNPPPKTM